MIDAFMKIIDEASADTSRWPERSFAVAGSTFSVRAEEPILPMMTAAIDHHPSDRSVAAELPILVWQNEPSPIRQAPSEWKVRERWARREPVHADGEAGSVFFDPIGRVVTLFDHRRSRAAVWLEDGAAIPIWIAAAPFLRLFDAWFVRKARLPCHAAAIARCGVAALIVGSGGAGKSTLAVRSIGAGFDYIGDDYVLLEPGQAPVVHNLYRSGKLAGADLNDPLPTGVSIHRTPEDPAEKHFLMIDPPVILPSAPLALVVVPVIADRHSPDAEEISAGEALRALLPSALRQLPGNHQCKLDLLSRSLQVRCMKMNLSTSTARNLALLDALLTTAKVPTAEPA